MMKQAKENNQIVFKCFDFFVLLLELLLELFVLLHTVLQLGGDIGGGLNNGMLVRLLQFLLRLRDEQKTNVNGADMIVEVILCLDTVIIAE